MVKIDITRRDLLKNSAATASGLAVVSGNASASSGFDDEWETEEDHGFSNELEVVNNAEGDLTLTFEVEGDRPGNADSRSIELKGSKPGRAPAQSRFRGNLNARGEPGAYTVTVTASNGESASTKVALTNSGFDPANKLNVNVLPGGSLLVSTTVT